jgi:uncharacterized protein
MKVTLLGGTVKTPASQGKSADAFNLEKAVGYFEQAIKLDPNYAPAWA